MDATEAFLREVDGPTEEEIRFPGATRDYLVLPMVRLRIGQGRSLGSAQAWEPRRFWHTGKNRRPAYWAVIRVVPGDDHTVGDWHDTKFKTCKAACAEAEYLARFEKTRALIDVKG